MKTILSCLAVLGLLIAVSTDCGSYNPCGPGQQECGDGTCAPSGNVCCGNGTSCPGGYVCGAGNTCLNPYVSSCASNGEETCYNNDGTTDCAPLGAACCGNHHWCPVGRVCVNGGNACQ